MIGPSRYQLVYNARRDERWQYNYPFLAVVYTVRLTFSLYLLVRGAQQAVLLQTVVGGYYPSSVPGNPDYGRDLSGCETRHLSSCLQALTAFFSRYFELGRYHPLFRRNRYGPGPTGPSLDQISTSHRPFGPELARSHMVAVLSRPHLYFPRDRGGRLFQWSTTPDKPLFCVSLQLLRNQTLKHLLKHRQTRFGCNRCLRLRQGTQKKIL